MGPTGRTVHVFGPRVEVPDEAKWVEVAAYTVPVGRLLVADLYQCVQTEERTPMYLFSARGLSWDAYTAEASGANPKRLAINPYGAITHTLPDGNPLVRGLVIPGGRRLIWGANIDPVPLGGVIDHVFGGIVGLEVDSNIDQKLLLELISRR